jgi:D-serine deaminase-like pyridoxal phosphate-dependent protein
MPNHAGMTAAACDRSHVVDEIVDVWERTNGW